MGELVAPDGTTVRWTETGAGPPLVLVHGGLSTVDDYGGLAAALGATSTVVAIGRRGYGLSDDRPEYSYDVEADDVVRVAEATGATRLVAHSSGAIVALRAAGRGRFDRVVLYEPPLPVDGPVIGPDARQAAEEAVAGGDHAEAVTVGLRDGVQVPDDDIAFLRTLPAWGHMCALAPAWVREFAEIDASGDESWWAAVDADVLLLWGDRTQAHHRQAVERLALVLPHATVRRLEGLGHEAPLLAPEAVADVVGAFL